MSIAFFFVAFFFVFCLWFPHLTLPSIILSSFHPSLTSPTSPIPVTNQRYYSLTAVDMVLLVAYLLSYHENYQAAKAQYGDALGQVTAPALQLVLACYFSQTTLYDEPLSKKVWLYYAQIPWGDFTSHLMKFFSLLHWSAHISPNTWNRALSVLYARLPQAAPAPPQPTLKQQLIFTSSASSTSDDYAVLNSSSDEESTSPMAVVATRSRTVPASGRS